MVRFSAGGGGMFRSRRDGMEQRKKSKTRDSGVHLMKNMKVIVFHVYISRLYEKEEITQTPNRECSLSSH